MLDVFITDLGDMNQTVLMNSDIYESAEINNISDRSGKHHFWLEILKIEYIVTENWGRQSISYITSRFFKLSYYIYKSRFAYSKLFGSFLSSLFVNLGSQQIKLSLLYVLHGIFKHLKKRLSSRIALGVNTGVIK